MAELDVRYIANLARLDLSETEIETYQSQLGQVLEHIETLSELDLEGVEPMAHATPVFDIVRDDVAHPDRCLTREAALSNAPDQAHDQFKVTKVVE